jgi:hypothetical protein
MKSRIIAAVVATVALIALAVGYALGGGPAPATATGPVTLSGPGLLIRDTGNGAIGVRDPAGALRLSAVQCARVYAAGGTGVCLRSDPLAPSTFEIAVLNTDLTVRRQIPLVGIPSRARVSASGRMISWTVFVTGDSYNGGKFSTRSGVLDLGNNALVGTLEDFAVTVDGKPYKATDLNFWGIAFAADDNRFYATMSSAGRFFLIEGDLAARSARTVREGAECPSLSPDNRRVVYKKRVSTDPARMWRLTVLDLATQRETPLAETRSVDDQAAWLDNDTIGYAVPRATHGAADVYAAPADGSGTPRLIAANAESPAML